MGLKNIPYRDESLKWLESSFVLNNKDVLSKDHKPEFKNNGKHLNECAVAYYRQVALNMRRARRQLNLTQQQIADAMDITRSKYSSLESGKVGIYSYYIAKCN